MGNQEAEHNMKRDFIWILASVVSVCMLMLILCVSGYAEGASGMGDPPHEGYTLFVGEFENRTDIVNPLLSYVSDTLNFLFSRSELAQIHTISAGLRSAYLQRARNEQPNVDAAELNLLAAEYGKADAVLVGGYSKTGAQWTMDAQLYVTREGSRAKEDICLSGDDVYRLLDGLAAEVGKRLGTGQYMLLSTPSWEAYEAYRLGHQSYYNFDLMGAVTHFQKAIELDPHLAVAHAELGLIYAMMSRADEARAAFAQGTKNLQYASEQEQIVAMGLEGFYKYFWVLGGGGGGLAGADIPRMREDMVWDEPWLLWYITETTEDAEVRNRAYKQWLSPALAYAKAGFHGAPELALTGVRYQIKEVSYERLGKCVKAFNDTKDPQFLEAALQFIEQAADVEANDEYDDAWKHWELSRIYNLMDRDTDVQQQGEKWLGIVKSKPLGNLSPDAINDIAGKCLEIGAPKDALQFAGKAVELESDPDLRSQYLVTLADAHLASGGLDEAFGAYVDAFGIFARGDAGTGVLDDTLLGLTRLVHNNPEFRELKRAELNEMMKTIENMDPLLFKQYSAIAIIDGRFIFGHTKDFCLALGDIGPILTLVRGMLKAETDSSEQLVFLSYLASFEDGITESELEKGMKEEKDASLRLNYKYILFSLYQQAGKYDEAKALMQTDGDIILEAEDAASITPRLRVEENRDASNGKYIGSPDAQGSGGEAEYTFEVSRPGDYRILGRVLAPHDQADSFFVSVDDGEKHIWYIIHHSISWKWSVVTTGSQEDDRHLAFNLTAGVHTLRIGNREDGTKLDMIVIAPL